MNLATGSIFFLAAEQVDDGGVFADHAFREVLAEQLLGGAVSVVEPAKGGGGGDQLSGGELLLGSIHIDNTTPDYFPTNYRSVTDK